MKKTGETIGYLPNESILKRHNASIFQKGRLYIIWYAVACSDRAWNPPDTLLLSIVFQALSSFRRICLNLRKLVSTVLTLGGG